MVATTTSLLRLSAADAGAAVVAALEERDAGASRQNNHALIRTRTQTA